MKRLMALVMLMACVGIGWGAVIQEDTMEIGLNGKLDFENSNGKVEALTQLSLGYFILNDIQLGGLALLACEGGDLGWGLGPYGEVTFDLDTAIAPYIALRLMANFGEYFMSDHLLVEGAGGLKFFLSESVALALELYYDLASKDIFNNNSRWQSYDFGMNCGVRAYF